MLDWSYYSQIEPWGAERDNMHAGIIAAMVFNMNRARSEDPRSFRDFMLRESDPEAESLAKTQKFVAGLRALAKPRKVK